MYGQPLNVNVPPGEIERAITTLLEKGTQFDAIVYALNNALMPRGFVMYCPGNVWALRRLEPNGIDHGDVFESVSFVAVLEEALRRVLPPVVDTQQLVDAANDPKRKVKYRLEELVNGDKPDA